MNKNKIIVIALIMVLLSGIILLWIKNTYLEREISSIKASRCLEGREQYNLYFMKIFIESVLDPEKKEVDFETRLSLENAARNLGDAEILEQWQKFTASKNEDEAQMQVKNLLELLVNKSIVKP